MSDNLVKTFLKFLSFVCWLLFFAVLILWYSENKKEFFPQRKIEKIINPINPFQP